MLAHSVYFTLKDRTERARRELLAGFRKYLSDHPGTKFFTCGILNEELARPVNDRHFDVVLLVIFTNKAAHDRYQESPKHTAFIAKFQGNWANVRVFDADVVLAPAVPKP